MNSTKLRYIGIELVFAALVVLASFRAERLLALPVAHLGALLVLGGFAVFRTARTISFNSVMAWLREPFCDVVKDSSGAGDSVEPKPGSIFGELLACPICSGTWAALVLVNVFLYAPSVGWVLFAVLGLAGMSEALHWTAERAEWQGRAAREEAGSAWMSKNEAPPLFFGTEKMDVHSALIWKDGDE
jgi:hypothetical protein